jgi:cyclic pyranopterin phosphate synthase
MTQGAFSHVDATGRLTMVDVTDKASTRRVAEARCLVVCDGDLLVTATSAQGFPPVTTARLEGIHAAKNTANLIPLCHPLALHDVAVDVEAHPRGVMVTSRVVTIDRTGVEMEALTACSFAALGVLHFVRELDPTAHIEEAAVTSKSGGASGDWRREGQAEDHSRRQVDQGRDD